ncbi:MAG: response regulator [Myxococcaceae bacterium]|nr:response regulator [Myxococcaceae bacterium]
MSPTILVVDDNKELVALLTSLFEEAGYTVVGANKGRPAVDLGKSEPVSLALVDMLLPDMMGYHVAEGLAAARPGLKLVFMTGVFKGARHSKEALERFPGALFVEKPFDAKKLLETVKGLVPPPAGTVAPPPTETPDFDVELDIDVEDEEQDAMELTGRIKVTGGGNITAELSGAALMAGKPLKGAIPGVRPTTSGVTAAAVPPPPPPDATEPSARAARMGELKDNLPGLITAFYLSRETGELSCKKGKVKKVVYFEAGQPVFALSNLAADRFGQFLVRVGKIKPDQLDDVAVVAQQTNRRTGDVLVERGLLKDTERLYYVGQQVKSIIYSLFGWEEGQFVLTFREKARAESIKLDVFPGNLIARGVKKLYKPERIARLVRPEDRLMPSPQPPYQLNEIELEKWEAQLLPRLDGTRTCAEIFALAQKPEHQVRAFLAAMLGLELLVKRET